jgi:RNA polymerase sigma-70 factor (ECF subfamily)
LFRKHWWGAVATVTRLVGDLAVAEDAVQEACELALERWPRDGLPGNPRAWLIGVARHKAVDRLRREAQRPAKESSAARELAVTMPNVYQVPTGDDELGLIFTCCHPALDHETRVALTLRAAGGLTTSEIAASFLVGEATMAKRLVRAKYKIRAANIAFRVPGTDALPNRLGDVLRVIYLIFTEGHTATSGSELIRRDLCATAVRLARRVAELLPGEAEASGLLALLLLTDARRPARTSPEGDIVLLEDQDRGLWDQQMIQEGDRLLQTALRRGKPGPYQLWAAIAACHSTSRSAQETDWRQIAALYSELLRYEPTPVVEANRAVAVAMAEGPTAGLVILDVVGLHPQLQRWPQLHVARADLLRRLGDAPGASAAYQTALELEPPAAERAFIHARLRFLLSHEK